jgi:hypothetical protein
MAVLMEYKEELQLRDEFRELVDKTITEDSCLRMVEIIRIIGEICRDDEVAHSFEDELKDAILKQVDHPLAKIALKTSIFSFSRWYS